MAGYQNTTKTDAYRQVRQRTPDDIPVRNGRDFIQDVRPQRQEPPSTQERWRGMVENDED
jgi:hypothetical protein